MSFRPIHHSSPKRRRPILVVVLALGASAILVGVMIYPRWSARQQLERNQRLILFNTDHAAIAAGCREVWENRSAFGEVDRGCVRIDPAHPNLPAAIRTLHANAIDALPSGVNIELGGQWAHYGFDAIFDDTPDNQRAVWKDAFPSRELVKGLWFYAENGPPLAE